MIIASCIPFAPISWWAKCLADGEVTIDQGEHFEKMSYRNRYKIAAANNAILLSIPLIKGRNQRTAMKDIAIFNKEKWQIQHWRTLEAAYKRSPYWEYYELSLKSIFDNPYDTLVAFNTATIAWTLKQLKSNLKISYSENYLSDTGESKDIRALYTKEADIPVSFPKYYQVFEDRIGFQPDLSILDLLMNEGPNSVKWMQINRHHIIG